MKKYMILIPLVMLTGCSQEPLCSSSDVKDIIFTDELKNIDYYVSEFVENSNEGKSESELSDLKENAVANFQKSYFSLSEVITVYEIESEGKALCKAKFNLDYPDLGSRSRNIEYLIQTDSDGKVHVSGAGVVIRRGDSIGG
jgi:uncharacterized protein YcfL